VGTASRLRRWAQRCKSSVITVRPKNLTKYLDFEN
jgi:hypothetical protein